VTCSTCRGSGHDHEGSCATCGGTGRLARGISVDVTVPARVRPGTKLRLAGMGGPGQPPGDAYVEVAVELPTGFRSEGRDLVGEVYVTPLEASRGLSAIVLGVPVSVPPGVRDGQGVQVAGGGLGGDLVLTVRIDIWRGLARAALDTARSALTAIRRTVTDERKLP
jgi:DnaJ-class molecular chaperone